MSSIDSNHLTNKINKILNTDLDEETLDALKNVSELVEDNTLTNRRNLRKNIEKQSVKITEQFVESFRSVENQLNQLYNYINDLDKNCQQMIKQIEETKNQTSIIIKATNLS